MSSNELIALAQEIFNRKSFQDDMTALLQREMGKVMPQPINQSKTNDQGSGINMVTGGYDFNGSEYVSRN